MRIVIGEDSALFREGLSALLGELGHEVVATAADAPGALAAILEHRPDVAVLDVRMPPNHAHDGAEFAGRIVLFRDGHIVSDTRHAPRSAADDLARLDREQSGRAVA